MNCRLTQLAREAGFIVWPQDPDYAVQIGGNNYTKQFEKFAELIIRECGKDPAKSNLIGDDFVVYCYESPILEPDND